MIQQGVTWILLVSLCWVWPLPSNSDHQDDHIFSRESQPKPLFVTVTGRGAIPNLYGIYDCFSPAQIPQAAFEAQELPGELETRQVGGILLSHPEKKHTHTKLPLME